MVKKQKSSSKKQKKSGQQGKGSKGKNKSEDDFELFVKQENWLDRFEMTAPRPAYEMALEMLKQSPLLIQGDELLYVMATLNELLTTYNAQPEQESLFLALKKASKTEYYALKPIYEMSQLDSALFKADQDQLQAIVTSWLKLKLNDLAPLILALENLFFYGHSGPGLELAERFFHQLRKKPNQYEEMREQAADYLIAGTLEGVAFQQAQGLLDKDALEATLLELEVEADEIADFQELLALDNPSHYAAFQNGFSAEPMSALFHLRLPFMRDMQESMNYYTSGEIAAAVFSFWFHEEYPAEKFEELTAFKPEALDHYLELLQSEFPDTHMPYLLLWGLPIFYDWLNKQQLLSESQCSTVLEIVGARQLSWLQTASPTQWRAGFIQHWNQPEALQAQQDQVKALLQKSFQNQPGLPDA